MSKAPDKRAIAIIGAGPTGILLAYKLISLGQKVDLFDAGYENFENKFFNRNRIKFETPSAYPDGAHRVGGGANLWMRRVGEFLERDFDTSKGSLNHKWPISGSQMEPYYKEAYQLLLEEPILDKDFIQKYIRNFAKINNEKFDFRLFRFAKPKIFLEMFAELKKNSDFSFYGGHACVKISKIEQGNSPQYSILFELEGRDKRDLYYEEIVISAGAIQSTGVVLRSPEIHNSENSRLLGSGLMEHFDGYIGDITLYKRKSPEWLWTSVLTKARKFKIQNAKDEFGFGIRFSDDYSPHQELEFAVEIVPRRKNYLLDPGNLRWQKYSDNKSIKKFLYSFFIVERLFRKALTTISIPIEIATGRRTFSLWVKGEELSNPNSRILRDTSQIDSTKIIYEHRISVETSEKLREELTRFKSVMESELNCKIHFYKVVESSDLIYLRPNWHPMGTLPISENAKIGFCDSNLMVHGSENVFICDSSVFPTGSNGNPSFMSFALACRLSHFIADRK
jgi:hypothetical protein